MSIQVDISRYILSLTIFIMKNNINFIGRETKAPELGLGVILINSLQQREEVAQGWESCGLISL